VSAFIARLIAEFHSGCIASANRGDGSGANLTLRFPLRAAGYNTGRPVWPGVSRFFLERPTERPLGG
jgi:hypothetical protein